MQRFVRQASIFFGLLLIVALVRLPYGSYRSSLLPWMKARAGEARILNFDSEDISLSFPAELQITKLSGFIPAGRFPVPLLVDRVSASLRFFQLLRMQTAVDTVIDLYQGKLLLHVSRSLFGGSLHFDLKGSGLQLYAHPMLQGLGLQGKLALDVSADAEQDPIGPADIDQGKASIRLTEGYFPGENPWLSLIKLPAISNIEANARAETKQGKFSVPEITLSSSLLSASGNGRGEFDKLGQIAQSHFDFKLKLSPSGVSSIGGFLALGAGISPEKPASEWTITTDSQWGRPPSVKIQPN